MSVVEYEREFDRLSKFATRHVIDLESKRRRFIVGLRAELRGQVRALQPTTFADALNATLALDIGDAEKKAFEITAQASSQKRKAGDDLSGRGTQPLRHAPGKGRGQTGPQFHTGHSSVLAPPFPFVQIALGTT